MPHYLSYDEAELIQFEETFSEAGTELTVKFSQPLPLRLNEVFQCGQAWVKDMQQCATNLLKAKMLSQDELMTITYVEFYRRVVDYNKINNVVSLRKG